jgi:hypothetical protein
VIIVWVRGRVVPNSGASNSVSEFATGLGVAFVANKSAIAILILLLALLLCGSRSSERCVGVELSIPVEPLIGCHEGL